MKKAVLVVSLIFVVTVGAFAANQTLTLNSPSTLNGQKLAAGQYEVKTTITGSTAEVKWLRNGKAVATATGQVAQGTGKSDHDGINSERNANGDATVKELVFRGSNTVVRFSGEASASGK